MLNSIYMSAAGALAAETRMDVVANNLANLETPGFRRGYAVFQERAAEVYETPRIDPGFDPVLNQLGGGLLVHEVSYSSEPGGLGETGESLDVAIEGDGWFEVEREGQRFYTRAGNFERAADGRLVTADGRANVLDDKGKVVVLPARGALAIDENGQIRAGDARVAQLALKGSLDSNAFVPHGDNLYRYTGATPIASASGRVRQGFLERSGVNPVTEMVQLIRTFRAYESNQRLITQQDQALGRAVNDVGRVA
ncbi:MAG: flagellar hook-basal body protein [Planctomycetota bacterium]